MPAWSACQVFPMRLETEAGQQSLKIMQLLTQPAIALGQKLPVTGGRDILPLTGLRFVEHPAD